MRKLRSDMVIDKIELIRTRNNKLWMDLLRLAVKSNPEKARDILKKITENDKEITPWLSRI